jgi:hypothetical protein
MYVLHFNQDSSLILVLVVTTDNNFVNKIVAGRLVIVL